MLLATQKNKNKKPNTKIAETVLCLLPGENSVIPQTKKCKKFFSSNLWIESIIDIHVSYLIYPILDFLHW